MKTRAQIWQRSFGSAFTAVNPFYSTSPIRIWRKQLILSWMVLGFLSCKWNETYWSPKHLSSVQPNQTSPGFQCRDVSSYSGIGNAGTIKQLRFVVLHRIQMWLASICCVCWYVFKDKTDHLLLRYASLGIDFGKAKAQIITGSFSDLHVFLALALKMI